MKFTYTEIRDLFVGQNNGISPIETLFSLDLPIKTAFKFKKVIKKLEEEAVIIEEMRRKLVKKYSDKKNQNGREYGVSDENIEKFQVEFDQILNKTLNVKMDPIPISEFKGAKISPKVLLKTEKFIAG